MGLSSIGQHNHCVLQLHNEAQVRTVIWLLVLWYRKGLVVSWSFLLPVSVCFRELSSSHEHSSTLFLYWLNFYRHCHLCKFVILLLSLSPIVLGNCCHHHLADEGKWLKWQKRHSVCKQDERKPETQMHFQHQVEKTVIRSRLDGKKFFSSSYFICRQRQETMKTRKSKFQDPTPTIPKGLIGFFF